MDLIRGVQESRVKSNSKVVTQETASMGMAAGEAGLGGEIRIPFRLSNSEMS